MAVQLLSLPPELLLKFLEGLSVEDVVRVAQTCSSLRSLVTSYKSSLCDTSNWHTLQLPFDRHPNTLSSELLHSRAAESSKTSSHIANSPLGVRGCFYLPFSDVGLEDDPVNPPTNFFVHRNIIAFRSQSKLLVIRISNIEIDRRTIDFPLQRGDLRYHIAYQLSEDQSMLCVASYAYHPKQKISSLQVREIGVSDPAFGVTFSVFQIELPAVESPWESGFSNSVSVRDPYAVVVTCLDCTIVNWRRGTGMKFIFFEPAEEHLVPLHTNYLTSGITSVHFHPVESYMILSRTYSHGQGNAKFFIVDIPTDMTPLTRDMSDDSFWIIKYLRPHPLPSFTATADDFNYRIFPKGFRRLPDSTWVFEAVAYGTSNMEGPLEQGIVEENRVFQVLYNVADWTYQTHFLNVKLTEQEREFFYPMGNYKEGGQVIFPLLDLTREEGDYHVIFPEFGNGSGCDVGWVKLKVEGLRENKDSIEEVSYIETWKAFFSAFNHATGSLYLCLPRGILIFKY
ncbi:hypothetical protein SISNIDRAFT_456093 [Sistotremastrum niveocremeum HHB9708]|uniref:F-box domain-containing protein n=1 Tax=Sistotremastrum niveocremeum HHB9708 TaxID=1314777 RepID=A0A164SYA1_9AGAM|nr:hypothetical protein SISNIDRAFT_456093 [Sistotremastrum niveocremeum HHB9708]